ncbi:MAG TPA: glycosyltransferase family 4 protein [Vicinamibacterales bacterium]|jgi:glycosyltransferase involved in cell wall biosynthesis|nr:glycosyltransferase family 4 protein [Vicinamibacterales bacterium]
MPPIKSFELPVTLIGHPFAPIGRGEDLRASYRAFKAAGLQPQIVNVFGGNGQDRDLQEELGPALQPTSAGGVDVYCINGDEVEPILSHLGSRPPSRYSVVFPTWELPNYPRHWAQALERFDEVWAPSAFVRESIAPAVGRPVTTIPEPTGMRMSRFLGRRYFGIPESAYAFLFAFDLRSYYHRKNPQAVIEAYTQVARARPTRDLALVVKMAGGDVRPEAAALMREELRSRAEAMGLSRMVVIERELTDTETKNLVHCCDCFVSLHRSEGFGRFLAEAMYLGKPVIATAWSGNLEFMNPDVACLVGYRLIPVRDGEYPFWNDQMWADPNVDEAGEWMVRLVDQPGWGRRLGEGASRHIRSRFSYRAIGLQYVHRLSEICN